jgi:hypothetical protein
MLNIPRHFIKPEPPCIHGISEKKVIPRIGQNRQQMTKFMSTVDIKSTTKIGFTPQARAGGEGAGIRGGRPANNNRVIPLIKKNGLNFNKGECY